MIQKDCSFRAGYEDESTQKWCARKNYTCGLASPVWPSTSIAALAIAEAVDGPTFPLDAPVNMRLSRGRVIAPKLGALDRDFSVEPDVVTVAKVNSEGPLVCIKVCQLALHPHLIAHLKQALRLGGRRGLL